MAVERHEDPVCWACNIALEVRDTSGYFTKTCVFPQYSLRNTVLENLDQQLATHKRHVWSIPQGMEVWFERVCPYRLAGRKCKMKRCRLAKPKANLTLRPSYRIALLTSEQRIRDADPWTHTTCVVKIEKSWCRQGSQCGLRHDFPQGARVDAGMGAYALSPLSQFLTCRRASPV